MGSFYITPIEAATLIINCMTCKDADCDAERTKSELVKLLSKGRLIKASVLEAALFCCNINDEDGKFLHPLDYKFDTFLRRVLDNDELTFDRYYNLIKEKRAYASRSKTNKR